MYLEAERAHLIRELMRMRESKGDIAGAAEASQEIQVEVCNSLNSAEKGEFLLEQVRPSTIYHLDSIKPGSRRLGSSPSYDSKG